MLKLSGLLGAILLFVGASMNLPERLMLSSWFEISRGFSLIVILSVVAVSVAFFAASFAVDVALSMLASVCGWAALSRVGDASVESVQVTWLVGALAIGFILSSASGFSQSMRLRAWPTVAIVMFFTAGMTSLFFNDVMFILGLVALALMGLLSHLVPDSFSKRK